MPSVVVVVDRDATEAPHATATTCEDSVRLGLWWGLRRAWGSGDKEWGDGPCGPSPLPGRRTSYWGRVGYGVVARHVTSASVAGTVNTPKDSVCTWRARLADPGIVITLSVFVQVAYCP